MISNKSILFRNQWIDEPKRQEMGPDNSAVARNAMQKQNHDENEKIYGNGNGSLIKSALLEENAKRCINQWMDTLFQEKEADIFENFTECRIINAIHLYYGDEFKAGSNQPFINEYIAQIIGEISIDGTPLKEMLEKPIFREAFRQRIDTLDDDDQLSLALTRLKLKQEISGELERKNAKNATAVQKVFQKDAFTAYPNLENFPQIKKLFCSLAGLRISDKDSESKEKQIILYNRWGNDVNAKEISNAITHSQGSDLTVIFYDKNISEKRDLVKGLNSEQKICVLSYEEIRRFFSEVNDYTEDKDHPFRAEAEYIVEAIDHFDEIAKLGKLGWVVDRAMFVDGKILCTFLANVGMLDKNNIDVSHQHITKVYDEAWKNKLVKEARKHQVAMADPNVMLCFRPTPQSLELLHAKNLTFCKANGQIKHLSIAEAKKSDLLWLNKADSSSYDVGKYVTKSGFDRTGFKTKHSGAFTKNTLKIEVPGPVITWKSSDPYTEIVEMRIGKFTYVNSKESWLSKPNHDSVEKMLDSFLAAARITGKIETLKYAEMINAKFSDKNITELELVRHLERKIEESKLTSQDFTQRLIFKSVNEEALDALASIPALAGKEFHVEYASASLRINPKGPQKSEYKQKLSEGSIESIVKKQVAHNQKFMSEAEPHKDIPVLKAPIR